MWAIPQIEHPNQDIGGCKYGTEDADQMTRSTRDLMLCEVVVASIKNGKGRGSFSARVSRLLALGYKPMGSPHYPDANTAILTLILDQKAPPTL